MRPAVATCPEPEEFARLARAHRVVPVWREVLADLTTPVSAFLRVVGDDDGFLLESVEGGDRWSRWSFIGRRPQATLLSQGGTLSIEGDLGVEVPPDRGMLAALGMRRSDIIGLILSEGLAIGILGALIGTVIGSGLAIWVEYTGINLTAAMSDIKESVAKVGVDQTPELVLTVADPDAPLDELHWRDDADGTDAGDGPDDDAERRSA